MTQPLPGPVPGLHGVVYVEDLTRCAAFYTQVCALQTVDGAENSFLTLCSDQVELSLVRMPDHLTPPPGDSAEPRRTEAAIKLSFPVADLGRIRDLAPALGGVVDDASTEWTFRGYVHCHGADPEGNVVSFRQRSGPE